MFDYNNNMIRESGSARIYRTADAVIYRAQGERRCTGAPTTTTRVPKSKRNSKIILLLLFYIIKKRIRRRPTRSVRETGVAAVAASVIEQWRAGVGRSPALNT